MRDGNHAIEAAAGAALSTVTIAATGAVPVVGLVATTLSASWTSPVQQEDSMAIPPQSCSIAAQHAFSAGVSCAAGVHVATIMTHKAAVTVEAVRRMPRWKR